MFAVGASMFPVSKTGRNRGRRIYWHSGLLSTSSLLALALLADNPAPSGAGLPKRDEAHYPKTLKREFRGRRFAAEDPRLLDYEGAEFVLIGARTDPEQAYDVDLEAEHETAENADIFRKLKLSRREHPLEPLLEGKWR